MPYFHHQEKLKQLQRQMALVNALQAEKAKQEAALEAELQREIDQVLEGHPKTCSLPYQLCRLSII